MSVVLDVVTSENYEPSETELLEYGKWLGMDLPTDKPFLWIAREGLKAPLPEHWKACRSEKGELYYFNFKTGESIWDHPLDDHFRELLQSEKKNPSPKSIANGATKPTPALTSPSKSLSERSTNQEEKTTSSGGKTKLQALKTLKQKRELPEELRIDFKSGGNLGPGSVERSRTAHRLKGVLSAAGTTGSKIPPLSQAQENINSSTVLGEKTVLGKGTNARKTSQNEAPDPPPQRSEELTETRVKTPLDQIEKDTEQEYQNRINCLKEDLEKKFSMEKDMLEKQYAADTERAINDIVARSESEKRKHQLLEEKHKQEYSEAKLRWQAEIDALNEWKTKEIEDVKKANTDILYAMKQYTKAMDECTSDFINAYGNAQNSFAKAVRESRESQLSLFEPSLSKLIDRAHQTYDEAIRVLNNCYDSHAETIKLKFAGTIASKGEDRRTFGEAFDHTTRSLPVPLGDVEVTSVVSRQHTESRGTQYEQQCSEVAQIGYPYSERSCCVSRVCNEGGNHSIKDILNDAIAALKEVRNEDFVELRSNLRKFAEEELRAALDKTIQERQDVTHDCSNTLHCTLGVEKHVDPLTLREEECLKGGNFPPTEFLRKEDLTAAMSEVLQTLMANWPPFASCKGDKNIHLEEPGATEELKTPSAFCMNTVALETQTCGFPISIQEQRCLLESETQRVCDMRKIIANHRSKLEKRRVQLKSTRHRWKEDMVKAKKDGVKASSHRGQLLNKVRHVLDSHIRKFEYDEAVLRGSEEWLLMKERNIQQMEQQIRDAEGLMPSVGVSSSDALIAAGRPPKYSKTDNDCSLGSHNIKLKDSLALAYTRTLNKIVQRLEQVAAVMHQQGRRHNFSS